MSNSSNSTFFGNLYIQISYNNTLISFTEPKTGNVVVTTSCGSAGFKKSKRGTRYAAELALEQAIRKIIALNIMSELKIFFKGRRAGRKQLIKLLRNFNYFKIREIADITPIPHNGCRPRKIRRK
nr:ribosomal protein S11 [Microheliella maris]